MPKISVCLPTYNGEQFLEEAIDSILNQTFQDFEVIICDDASKDSTPEIINRYAEQSNKIRYYRNSSNLGIFHNWNKCLEYTSGEYITIFGQDDVMLPRNLEARVNIFEAYPTVGLVTGAVHLIDGQGQKTAGPWSKFDVEFAKGQEWLINNAGSCNDICCPFVFLRRKALDKVGGKFNFECTYAADFEMWQRIALVSDLYFIPEILGNYRLHGSNETYNQENLTEIKEVLYIAWNNTIDALSLSSEDLKIVESQALSRAIYWILHSGMISRHIKNGNLEYALEICRQVETWRGQDAKISEAVKWFAQSGAAEIASSQGTQAEIQKLQSDKSWLEAKSQAWMQTATKVYNDALELKTQISNLEKILDADKTIKSNSMPNEKFGQDLKV